MDMPRQSHACTYVSRMWLRATCAAVVAARCRSRRTVPVILAVHLHAYACTCFANSHRRFVYICPPRGRSAGLRSMQAPWTELCRRSCVDASAAAVTNVLTDACICSGSSRVLRGNTILRSHPEFRKMKSNIAKCWRYKCCKDRSERAPGTYLCTRPPKPMATRNLGEASPPKSHGVANANHAFRKWSAGMRQFAI